MKWIVRLLAVLVLALAALAVYAAATARSSARPVGFQVVQKTDAEGRPMPIGIWYPTSGSPRPTTFLAGTLLSVASDGPVLGQRLPLVVLSHGNGGGLASHADLAMDLAGAGYVVAAPMHAGDNYADQSAAASPTLFTGRAQQVSASLDYMLGEWAGRAHLDPGRVGAYGLSAGGFTVLTLVGARPDLGMVPAHCARTDEFVCKVLRQVGSPLLDARRGGAGSFERDERIKAAVVAAPGLGFTFGERGLADVHVPVQLWSGDRDDIVPFATNAKIVRDGLGERAEHHAVAGAGHLSFLAPCGLLKPPAACSDPDGFDRDAFHARMNPEVIRFFDARLPADAGRPRGDRS